MSRTIPYLGIALALLVGVFVALFAAGGVDTQLSPDVTFPIASSALSVVSEVTLPVTLPGLGQREATSTKTTAATSTQKVSVPEKIAKEPVKPAPVPIATSTTSISTPVQAPVPTFSSGNASLDVSASALRAALVNIVCYVPAGSPLHSMSGSGIFIDSKGVILTNAHVAQYFLLRDRNVSCTIRSGSPAVNRYKAALIYISPSWIRTNPTVLTQVAPSGTGEYDFALLAVTSSATSEPLPALFPYVPLAETPPASLTPIVIASFGAQFLETSQIQSSLYPTIVFGSIKDVYTFAVNTIDILALGGSAAAQEGSSGGGVADATGSLVGTITTSTIQGATDTRNLTAITASYIRAQYAREMNSSLDSLLAESTDFAVSDFAPQIPQLEAIITAGL